MLRLILIASIFMVGCANAGFYLPRGIDPEFQSYVDDFLELAGIETIYISMYFEEQEGKVIGVCKYGEGQRKVEIDTSYWNAASDTSREILIFHELGHCVLDQRHRDFVKEDSFNCKGSIMNPQILNEWCYNRYYEYYIEEMFYD